MDFWDTPGINWEAGPKAVVALYAGFFEFECNDLWKLVDKSGEEVLLTSYQRTHIQECSQGIFNPVENGKWKISFITYKDSSKLYPLNRSPVPTVAEEGHRLLLCITYHGEAREYDTIELVYLANGRCQPVEFWKTLSKEEEEEDERRQEEWENSAEYFKRLEERSRYEGDTLSDGYSGDNDDDESNIMRGLDSSNGDQFGY